MFNNTTTYSLIGYLCKQTTI
jgi:hypothetical protein